MLHLPPFAEGLREVILSYRGVGSTTLSEAPGCASLVTGVPFIAANLVAIWADPKQAPGALDETLRPLLGRALPFLVWVLPPADAAGIGARLLRAGLAPGGSLPAMLYDLKGLPAAEPIDGVSITTVADVDSMTEWLDAFHQVYGWPRDALRLFMDLFKTDHAQEKRWEFYLAKAGGKPIGGTSNFFGSKISGLYSQGVIPEVRRQGVGTALVYHALGRAKERGYEDSMLFATPEGVPLYRKCGYREIFKAPVFVRQESAE